jgi:hypothetical protein
MNIVRLILDICLLRGRAQDLPASNALVWLTAAVSVMVDILSMPEAKMDVARLLYAASQVVLFGASIWAVLKLRGFPARWMQTISALYAANALFSLLLLPFLPALADMVEKGPGAALGWQAYVMFALSIWFLAVMARVLREATEMGLLASFFISIACLGFVRFLGLLMAPLFGFSVQA